MLIFNTTDGDSNCIHLVIGPQTDLQFDMSGFVRLDISEMLERYPDKSLPLNLILTRSDNEAATMAKLRLMNHPAVSGMIEADEDEEDEDDTPAEPEQSTKQVGKVKDPRGLFTKKFKCPMCGEPGVFLKENRPVLCGDCMKIELGLGRASTPEDQEDSSENKEE